MSKNIQQVVILCGGKGTRMREMTETLPKPMVQIGNMPVLEHLINIFEYFGKFEYILCAGYKKEIIEKYFKDWGNVKVVDTGEDTNTGGRLYNVKNYLSENFIVTYGDGLANVNIKKLVDFHFSSETIGTMTVTNPTSRFGLVEFDEKKIVKKFVEKPKLEGFINIGFMTFNKGFLHYLDESSTLESTPLKRLSDNGSLKAFVHDDYFEPMDTYREYQKLNNLWKTGKSPWMKF